MPISRDNTAVRFWLLAVAFLVFLIVIVGGATRLTESGLSIVEWRPVTGTLPPFSESAWTIEFEKYKTIPQYEQINRGMSLADFKTIYLWEWGHRLLGRIIGIAFFVPFMIFLWRGALSRALQWRLWMIFGLGALQGAVGWWMVASGLSERISVSQYRLAFHLTLASMIFASLLWTARRLAPRSDGATDDKRGGAIAMVIVALILAQIYLGGLVAGLDAGLVYNTWPLLDGRIIPDSTQLFAADPWWRNLFENALTVQFNHRILAYGLWGLAMLHAIDIWRRGDASVRMSAFALAFGVTLQAALGIATLLAQAPLGLALAHQGLAILVLAVAVFHAERLIAPRLAPAQLIAAASR